MMDVLRRWGFFSYGKVVPGLVIDGEVVTYSVLNERAVRAGASMMFLLGAFSFFQAFYLSEYQYIRFVVLFFLFDFVMKAIVGQRFSPISRLAQVIVRGQKSEFIPAAPKRFAWLIGLVLATTMSVLIFGFEIQGLPNLMVCLVCLTMMFFESAFGICIGCAVYQRFIQK